MTPDDPVVCSRSFSCVSSLQSLEEDKASWMVQALSKSLLQPLDVPQSSESKLQVVLIMKREEKNKKKKRKQQEEARSAPETGTV